MAGTVVYLYCPLPILNMSTTLKQLIDNSRQRLVPLYGEREASWLVRTIIEHIKGWNQVEILLNSDKDISDFMIGEVEKAVVRLLANEPIQYIYGDTYWYGMTLKVAPSVLIPRPETEELVDIIVKAHNNLSDLKVLDVCTGSGCIAVALATYLRFPEITAIDISSDAIDIANINADNRKVKIKFLVDDATNLPMSLNNFDIIVSNPPYIMDSEKSSMSPNVLDYEPSLALFAPDSDPLKFYKSIASFAFSALKENGVLYFELNPLTADNLYTWMNENGWSDVQMLPDMYSRTRFMIARKQ